MPALAGKYPSTQAAMSYTNNVTANQSTAASWGMNMDMSGMPDWSSSYAAENVLYTRAFLAMNPETLNADGSVNLSGLGSNAVMLPIDVASMSANNADNSTGSYGSPASSSTPSSASSPSASAVGGSSKSSNGAGALSSPRLAVALVAVAAAFFAL